MAALTRLIVGVALAAAAPALVGCAAARDPAPTATPSPTASPSITASTTPAAAPTSVPSPIPAPPRPKIVRIAVDYLTPNSGTYGVAMPVTVTFAAAVPARYRPLVEDHLAVKVASDSPVLAAWSWTGDRTVTLRPRTYWPAGARVRVDARMGDQRIAVPGKNKVVRLTGGYKITLRIGRAQITRIDSRTHYATVTRDGEQVRRMPVSLGKPGWETRSGTKVIMERYKVRRMTSAELGADEYYDLQVPYAMRITSTGEFLHAAPWATGRLGRANGSHGCTNLSTDDARWLFTTALMGDPVITRGTGRPMETWNGLGGMWNVKWKAWLSRSATGPRRLGTWPGPATGPAAAGQSAPGLLPLPSTSGDPIPQP